MRTAATDRPGLAPVGEPRNAVSSPETVQMQAAVLREPGRPVAVETVLLPAQAVVGAMEAAADWLTRTPPEQRPPVERTVAVLSQLIWQGLDGLGRAEARAATDAPVPLRPRAG